MLNSNKRGTLRRGIEGGVPLCFFISRLQAAAKPTETGSYLADSLGQVQNPPVPVGAPSLLPTLLNIAVSLIVVILLVYAVAWLLRQWLGARRSGDVQGQSDRLIQILDRRYLDSKRGLAVVDMGGEVLFLGLGEEVTLLHRVDDPARAEELRQSATSQKFFKGFPQQFDKISSMLRTNQWKKNRQSLKSQSDFVKEQTERLKPLSRKDEE